MDLNTFIIQLLHERGDTIHGRVQLQKLVYFCKALGVNINASYKLYIYGPYSQQVADALQDCVADDILTEANGIIEKGKEYDEFFDFIVHTGTVLDTRSKSIVHDILQLCATMTTKELEITATTFFINRQQKALFGDDNKEVVIRKVSNAKGNRFNQEEIERSYYRVSTEFLALEKKYALAM